MAQQRSKSWKASKEFLAVSDIYLEEAVRQIILNQIKSGECKVVRRRIKARTVKVLKYA